MERKNYFEHEIRVKFIDNYTIESQDWSWLITYIEENFEPIKEISDYKDFRKELNRITDVIRYLNQIAKIVQVELGITEKWLKNLYFVIRQVSLSDIDIDRVKEMSDFNKLLVALLVITKTINANMGTDYLFATNVFEENNTFQIFNLENIDKDFVVSVFDLVSIDIIFNKQIFLNNIDEVLIEPSSTFLDECQSIVCSPNSIDFCNDISISCVTWQERTFLDMLKVDISEERKIVPIAEFGEKKVPDIDLWEFDYLKNLADYYNDDRSNFLIETINYIKNGAVPSENTINRHLGFAIDVVLSHIRSKLEYNELWCTSLLCTIFFFNDGDAKKFLNEELRKQFVMLLDQVDDISFLVHLLYLKCPLSKMSKNKIEAYVKGKQDAVIDIADFNSLDAYLSDDDIVRFITKNNWYLLSDKFEYVISDLAGMKLSCIFLKYYSFLKKLQKNERQSLDEVRAEIIYVRSLWKDKYYKLSSKGYKSIQHSFELESERIEELNELILENPFLIAYECMGLSEKKICESISTITGTPLLLLIEKIVSSEDFPYKPKVDVMANQVDGMVFKLFDECNLKNGYKFLNSFSSEEMIAEYYLGIKANIKIFISMFDKEKELYDVIKDYFGKHLFISYSENLTIAHITQLFPFLEIAIREFGESLAISSIDLSGKYEDKVRLGSSVLIDIIEKIVTLTTDIKDASDFIFVYFTMFSSNGFNIRNELIHGIDYLKEDNLKFVFRVTLLSIYLIIYRMSPKKKLPIR